MAAHEYLDEEYFQIQDLLSILTDSLPKIEPDSITNIEDIVGFLVEQNKAYGKKIISLFETLDSVYKSSNPLEASPGNASPDFNSRLHQKIQDYEELVKRLTAENEDFSTQIRQLSHQIESLKYQNQPNLSGSMSEKKSTTISNLSPSPLPKGSKSGTASREISLELENMFGNAEYKKGVELLTQIDYKKPLNVGPEKFNTWLIIANRMKDASFNEVLNKLKILLTFAEKDEDEEGEGGLDDSLDRPSQTVAEKIYALLDEKLPKIILKSEYKIETQKLQDKAGGFSNGEEGLRGDRGPDSLEDVLDDDNLTSEQLKLKVKYLNGRVEQLEKAIRENQMGGEGLKGSMRNVGSYGNQDELIRTNEKLLQDLQQQADNTLKLESQARDVIDAYEDLKDKYEGILKEIADYDIKCQDLTEQLKENGEFIDRLLQENARLKEQYEFSEKLEDLEKQKELLQEKDLKIKALAEELSLLKEYQKTPRDSYSESRKYINDTEGSRGGKGQIAVEHALQVQGSFLHNVRQALSDLRSPILETLKNLGLDLPQRQTVPPLNDELENPTTEAQRLLRSNNSILRDIASDLNFVRGSTANISSDISNANYRALTEKYTSFTNRLSQAEEKLFDNLTNSIQTVSELITLLNELSATSKVGGQMSQVHNLLQGLHTNITKTIQEYPDFSAELGIPRGQLNDLNSPPKRPNHSFKDKLVKDQSELKTKLRSTLQHLESYQANEIYSKLCQEIERNQELHDQIEPKNVAIYRMHLVFNEGMERSNRSLEQLVKLADSEEAQGLLEFVIDEISTVKTKLREIVETNKTGGWTLHEAIAKMEQEFETQKEMWKKSVKDLQEADEKQVQKLIREIEGERKAHDITHSKLLQLQKEMAQSEKTNKVTEELRIEVETLNRKTREREFDLEEKEREIEGLRRQIRDLEKERANVFTQLDRMKGDMTHIGQEKGRLREEKDEMRKALENINDELDVLRRNSAQKNNELDQLRKEVIELNRENDEITGRLTELKDINEDMKRALEKSKNECKALGQQLNEAFEKKQKEIEPMRRAIEELERENEELKDYKASTEVLFKKTNEQVDQLKISYFSDVNSLKEENTMLTTQKRQFTGDLERKNQEIAKLNQMLDSLQEFSNKQLETLKEREEKMALLSTQKREMEHYVRDLERRVEELTEKNRRYSDSINQNTADVQMLKEEVHQLMEKQAGLQRDLVLSKQRNEELAHQNHILTESREDFASGKGFLEDKVRKMNEILQITKNELKNSRELVEEKNRELAHKEDEIMELRESMRRERESVSQSDLVPRLKRELQVRSDELSDLKRDYKKSLEQNEKLNIEIDTLRASNRLGDQHMREIERTNELNRNMSIEIETLRKSVKQRDEQFLMERENYERELQLTRKKVNDLQSILETKDRQTKNVPKSYAESSLKSSVSSSAGSSSYYSSLVESKDLEIKRLTQIVKSLTENLRDTQESKYKLKK